MKKAKYAARRWVGKDASAPMTCSHCQTVKTLAEFYASSRGVAWAQCKTCVAAVRRKQRAADPAGYASRNRAVRLRLNYGMTPEDYAALLARQDGGCAVCGAADDVTMPVDHDHRTGQVRGVLCGACNRGLGSFRDDPILLQNAAAYVKAARAVAHA